MAAILGKVESVGSSVALKGRGFLDRVFPPEQRAELFARIKAFVLKNPKISAFLLTNIVLTGGPLVLFVLFSLSVFIFALIVAVVIALISAVAFTLVAVGFALLILFPTILFTSFTATFLFLWGLGGFYIFKYFNRGASPGAKGDTVGDKLNSLTGNKLDFIMDNAREGVAERRLGDSHKEWREPSSRHAPQQVGEMPKEGMPIQDRQGSNSESSATTSGADIKNYATTGVSGMKVGTDSLTEKANAASTTNALNGVAGTAGVDDVGGKVSGAPTKLASGPGNVKGTAVGTLGGATGLV